MENKRVPSLTSYTYIYIYVFIYCIYLYSFSFLFTYKICVYHVVCVYIYT